MIDRFSSLKARLGLGAGLIGLGVLLASALVIYGMVETSARIDASLEAERRIERYSVLSTQITTFIVVAVEATQSGIDRQARSARLEGLAEDIRRTFVRLRGDLEKSVGEAGAMGLDEQSRRATVSLGLARMQALFESAVDRLNDNAGPVSTIEGEVNAFLTGFDPLINAVITDEIRTRTRILDGIADLRRLLIRTALGIAAAAMLVLALFYLGLVRPQLLRLDRLRDAARDIGRGDFEVSLPQGARDEIGALFAETSRMAAALADRKAEVAREWARLNQTIADQTEELRDANAALARIDRDRRRFFADISHELRTPLTVIAMESELGQKGAADPAAAFDIIHSRALRLNRRIEDLLRVARSEAGQLALDPEILDLRDAARAAVDDVTVEAATAGMILTLDAAEPAPVFADANWTRQVIAGLIRNAVRHARSGGKIGVIVSGTTAGAQLRVVDNGPGLGGSDPETLFGRFAQGDGEARGEGFGLGLSLAKWVTETQGGTIDLRSPVPAPHRLGDRPGTMVTLALPALSR